jgi:hypothetical protein
MTTELLTHAHVDRIHDLHLSSLLLPFPFCLCSFHIFFASFTLLRVCLPISVYILSPVLALQPSLARPTLPYSCLYPIPNLPSTRQSCHFPHQFTGELWTRPFSQFSIPHFPILSFPLQPRYLLADVLGYQKQTDIF